MSTIPERFRGKDGKARLLKALRAQKVVCDDEAIAKRLLAVATPATFYPRKNLCDLMTEGESTSDIYFILSGRVAIRIKGTQVNERVPGDHVGEMALIDTAHARSATVTALEKTEVCARFRSGFYRHRERLPPKCGGDFAWNWGIAFASEARRFTLRTKCRSFLSARRPSRRGS